LRKAKDNHAITVVNTVYDFLNEKKNPLAPWPLGSSMETYKFIDLLITDMEEALRLSGQQTIDEALAFFKTTGVGAVVVTHGANPVHYYSKGMLFGYLEGSKSVSVKIKETIVRNPEQAGDTTGCGDNFAGGVIASISTQLLDKYAFPVNFEEAVSFGIASGGYACFYHGGTFYEDFSGQKRQLIEPYYRDYLLQR
jgi:sugar/nucleoside kinase (ribokinase family)